MIDEGLAGIRWRVWGTDSASWGTDGTLGGLTRDCRYTGLTGAGTGAAVDDSRATSALPRKRADLLDSARAQGCPEYVAGWFHVAGWLSQVSRACISTQVQATRDSGYVGASRARESRRRKGPRLRAAPVGVRFGPVVRGAARTGPRARARADPARRTCLTRPVQPDPAKAAADQVTRSLAVPKPNKAYKDQRSWRCFQACSLFLYQV
jgi:hypothetical protein